MQRKTAALLVLGVIALATFGAFFTDAASLTPGEYFKSDLSLPIRSALDLKIFLSTLSDPSVLPNVHTWVIQPTATFLVICATLYITFRNSDPSKTRPTLFTWAWLAHDVVLAVLSLVMTLGMAHQMLVEANGSLCSGGFYGRPFWIRFFAATKWLEMFDVFFRLIDNRTAPSVLLYLLWHHGTQPLLMYVFDYSKWDAVFFGFFMNTLSHTIAYAFLAARRIRSIKPSLKAILPDKLMKTWAKYNVIVQMAQFFLTFSVAWVSLARAGSGCQYDDKTWIGIVNLHAIYGSYFLVFLFLFRKYNN